MDGLLAYAATIYDTHCIVYYCFRSDLPRGDGTVVVVEYEFTEKIREITKRLVDAKKKVHTLQEAWNEVIRVAAARAVVDMLSREDVRRRLGLRLGVPAPGDLRWKLTKNLDKKVRAFRYEPWFYIEPAFAPSRADLVAVRDLYKKLASDPTNHHRFKPYKDPIPSDTDISLILYSGRQRLPLLTNDSGIYEFDIELSQAGFCQKIRSLPGVVL